MDHAPSRPAVGRAPRGGAVKAGGRLAAPPAQGRFLPFSSLVPIVFDVSSVGLVCAQGRWLLDHGGRAVPVDFLGRWIEGPWR